MACSNRAVDFESTPAFQDYVEQLKQMRKMKRKKSHLQEQLLELLQQLSNSLPLAALQKRTEKLSSKVKELQDKTDKMTFHNSLPLLAAPVMGNLDSALHKRKTYPQAYHGKAFIRNHCHKYLKAEVTETSVTTA